MNLCKVLVVDDEKIIRDGISLSVNWQDLGMELIGTCEDGFDALEIFENNPPRIAVIDIRMPGMSGLELVENVRKKGIPIHFIILSGYGEFEYARQAITFGVRQYLLKPIDPEKLKNALIEVMDLIKLESKQNKWTLERGFRNALTDKDFSGWDIFSESQELDNKQYRVVAADNLAGVFEIENDQAFWQSHADLEFLCGYEQDNYNVYLLRTDHEPGNDSLYDFLGDFTDKFSKNKGQSLAVSSSSSGSCRTIYRQWQECKEKILEFELRKLISIEDARAFSSLSLVIKKLKQNILQNKESNVKKYCDQIFSVINDYKKNLQSSKEMIFRILNWLIVGKQEKNKSEWLSLQMEILNSPDQESLKKNFFRSVVELFESREKSGSIMDSPWLVEKTKQEIHNNYNDHNLSLRTFCSSVVFTNPDYLGKLFQKYAHQSFHAYLNRVRIDAAKQLIIQNPYIAMYEVAYKVGFGDNSHYFSKVFKSLEDVTPSQFKERVKNGFLL